MSNISYIKYNNTSIVIRVNGKHLSFQNESEEKIEKIFKAAKLAKQTGLETDKEDLLSLVDPLRRHNLEGVVEYDNTGNVFLGDTKVPMPNELGELIIKFSEEDRDLQPLINFWRLCLLNPNEEARDNFFKYVRDYGIVITDNGYVILYKALNKRSEGNLADFSDFVGEQYLKIKRMKKSPANYDIYAVYTQAVIDKAPYGEPKVNRFEISTHSGNIPDVEDNETIINWGNLQDTYNKISVLDSDRKTVYTPWYKKGNYGNEVKLGEPVDMPREKCDPSINASCSKGLHVGSFSYVSAFGSKMDRVLACLVNPKNIVALPKNDHSKIRTCEYYPYAVMETDEHGNWEELEEQYFEEDYKDEEIDSIKKRLDKIYANKMSGDDIEREKSILSDRLVDLKS